MKRISVALVALLAMLVTASAMAATNKYTVSYGFHGSKGSASKPAALSFSQDIKAKAPTSGARTNLIHDIKTTIAGVKVNVKGFPTCTAAKIASAQSDSSCPKKALVASGSITAVVAPSSPFTATATNCNPDLDVWNAGAGKLAFFFVIKGSHQCLGGQLHTGSVAPFPATYHQSGSKLNVDIPVPNTVDYPAGQSANLTGSLVSEKLFWKSQTMNGKPDIASTGCSGKRAYSFSFLDSLPGKSSSKATVSGKAACG